MKRYETYKPSGVEWLGEIPEHWEVRRIKDCALLNQSVLSDNTANEYQFKYIDIGNVNQTGIIQEPEILSFGEAPSRARRIIKENDVIISTVRTYLKAIAFIDFNPKDYIVSTGFAVLSHNRIINPRFLSYHSQSDYFIDSVIRNSTGVSYPAINAQAITALYVIFPKFKEQTTISNYLDTKTTAIDRKTELLSAKVNKYKALRRSLINETVCRGLNPKVRQKDSGIEWIGMIPEHWQVDRLKNLCKYISRGITPDYAECSEFKVINQATFSQGIFDDENIKFTTKSDKRAEAKVNDIIVASTGGGVLGKVYFINSLSGKYYPDSHVTTIRTNSNYLKTKYLYYYLSISFELINGIMAKGSTNQTELQRDSLLGFNWCVPPINEQIEIVDYLNAKTTQIDTILNNISEQINKLSQLRKTLINDVITGKIKVTE